jgi:hypothetical protein
MFHPYAEARMDKGMKGEISPFKLLSAIGSLSILTTTSPVSVKTRPRFAKDGHKHLQRRYLGVGKTILRMAYDHRNIC